MKNNQLEEKYTLLLKTTHNGKEIWQQFNEAQSDSPLTGSIAFKGSHYDSCKLKLMVIGRAMNGWETDYSSCLNVVDIVNTILNQDFSFADIINSKGFCRDGKRPYRYITSKFWKLIKYILEEYGEANHEWYDEFKNTNWNEKIVWSNLYKISPRYENNPDVKLMRNTIEINIEILKIEIAKYNPEHILFVTDRWYMEPCETMPSFKQAFQIEWSSENTGSNIVGYGTYNNSKIIVCKRPDVRGYTNDKIHDMAKEIKEAFDFQ